MTPNETPDAGKSEAAKTTAAETAAAKTEAANAEAVKTEVRSRRAGPATAIVALLALGAVGFALYGIGRPTGKNTVHSGACAKSLDLAQAINPLTTGDFAALTTATQPNSMSAIAFDDADGRKTTVDTFKGRTVLLNLWATWCVPCRAEMPSLDKLQGALGSKDFSIVAVNIDQTRLDKPRAFLKEIGASALPFYSDKSAEIVQTLKQSQKVYGLPTSILIGADGCEIGTMAGPAQWDSPEAKTLIERVLKGGDHKAV